ncbi:MAG: hypothetical protein ACOYIP_07315 [Coriobacteriales bacterium]|jgi:hypothetical protein
MAEVPNLRSLRSTLPAAFAGGRLELVDVRARSGAVDFKLRVRGGDTASPALVAALQAVRPTLAEHTCTSDDDDDEPMTMPHLVEHVAIDLLVERRAEPGDPIAGYTVWLDRRRGLARITLSSTDCAATGEGMLAACQLVAQYIEEI